MGSGFYLCINSHDKKGIMWCRRRLEQSIKNCEKTLHLQAQLRMTRLRQTGKNLFYALIIVWVLDFKEEQISKNVINSSSSKNTMLISNISYIFQNRLFFNAAMTNQYAFFLLQVYTSLICNLYSANALKSLSSSEPWIRVFRFGRKKGKKVALGSSMYDSSSA